MSDISNENETADLEAAREASADTAAPPPEEVIARLETEKEELRTQFLRLYADLDNTRKRAEREVSEARVYGIGKFAGDLLNVADNLARALAALPDADR